MIEAQKQRHVWRFFMPASLWRVSQSSLVLTGPFIPVLPPLIHSPPYPVATINNKKKVDDMTTQNQNPLEIWESRQFKPWGIGEKSQFWVARKTTENGQTILNDHVAGPFDSMEEARDVLRKLNEFMFGKTQQAR